MHARWKYGFGKLVDGPRPYVWVNSEKLPVRLRKVLGLLLKRNRVWPAVK